MTDTTRKTRRSLKPSARTNLQPSRRPAEVCDALLMFEGFNERADQVVVRAQQSARDLGHSYNTFWDGRPRW
jgi:hypothetical protein